MKTKSLTSRSFAEQCTVPALASAVIRQSGGWEAFKEKAYDVAYHGASGGFSGWTYYTETAAFAMKHRASILEQLKEDADAMGMSVFTLVQSFNCLSGSCTDEEIALTLYGRPSQADTQVANALAWYALEETARRYDDIANG